MLIKAILARLALMCFGVLLSLLMVEFSLAKLYPQKTYQSVQVNTNDFFRESEYLIWELNPNYEMVKVNPESLTPDYSWVKINSLGFRDTEFSRTPPPDTYRIMMLGDSFTFGLGVSNFEDYPAIVESCLNTHLYSPEQSIEVINAGYASGFSPDSFYVFARQLAPRYEPDLITVGFYVDNDFLDLYDTVWLEEEGGYPLRIASQTRDINLQGELTYRATLPRYQIPILRDWHTFQLVMELLMNAGYFQGEVPEFVANPDYFLNVYESDFPQVHAEVFEEGIQMLKGIQGLGQGSEFAVVLIPSGIQTDATLWSQDFPNTPYPTEIAYPQAHLISSLDELGIDYFDLLPVMRGHSDEYFQQRLHWTVEGHERAGQAICQYLLDQNLREQWLQLQGTVGIRDVLRNQLIFYQDGDVVLTFKAADLHHPTENLQPHPDVPEVYQLTVDDTQFPVTMSAKGELLFYTPLLTLAKIAKLENQLPNYETFIANLPQRRIFNPSTFDDLIYKQTRDQIYTTLDDALKQGLPPEPYYELIVVYLNSLYEHNLNLTATQTEHLTAWRGSKSADDLIAAGVEYLLVLPEWRKFLTDAEVTAMNDERYQPISTWEVAGLGEVVLYQIRVDR